MQLLAVISTVAALSSLVPVTRASSSTQPSAALPHTNTVFKPARYSDLEQWRARREWLRDQVRLAAGLVPEPPRTPLNARIFGKLERDGYTIEKVYFESAPGIYVAGNLYRPAAAKGRVPGVACPHGHWANGRLHHDDTGSIPARCITLARHGAVAFAYDMVGYNDASRGYKHRDPHLDTPETSLWGIGHLQLQTWNSIRVIDFLQSLPDVDPARIGVTGASGGGTQTFILGAVDDRVAVDCPVNMISSTMQGGCICENAPLLRIDTNNMEIAALFAPRPRLMVSATGDWTKLTPSVEFPFVRGIYSLYGARDRLENVHIDAPHNYNLQSREAMYRFFGKWLLHADHPDQIKEGPIAVEKPEDMLVFDDANVPADLPNAEQTVELNKRQLRELLTEWHPASARQYDELTRNVQLWLQHAVGSKWPAAGEILGKSKLIEYPGDLWRIEARRNRGGRHVREAGCVARPTGNRVASNVVLCVDPDGLAGVERHKDLVNAVTAAGWRVVFIEPLGTGSNRRDPAATQPAGDHKFFSTFNRTDAAETVFDITTSLQAAADAELSATAPGVPVRIRLVGFGRMGPLCLLARAMASERLARTCDLRVTADLNGIDWSMDAAYVDHLFVPLIQRFGGLPAIAAACANGPLWLHNVSAQFDRTWIEEARGLTRTDVRITPEPAGLDDMTAWLTSGY